MQLYIRSYDVVSVYHIPPIYSYSMIPSLWFSVFYLFTLWLIFAVNITSNNCQNTSMPPWTAPWHVFSSSRARGRRGWLHQYQLFSTPVHPLQKLLFLHHPMKSPTRSVVVLRSFEIIFRAISATHCPCNMQCLRGEWVDILRFPRVVYLSWNWDGYLRCQL